MGQAFEVSISYGLCSPLAPPFSLPRWSGWVRCGWISSIIRREDPHEALANGRGVATLRRVFGSRLAGSLPFGRGLVGLAVSSGLLLLVGLVDDARSFAGTGNWPAGWLQLRS